MVCTPRSDTRPPLPGVWWAADNGCFGSGYPGDAGWLRWLERLAEHAGRCLFATAPDVVGHAAATLARSAPHLPTIRGLGYPAALVAQDGLEELGVPWETFDVLFIGGSTAWKLGPGAAGLVGEARPCDLPLHRLQTCRTATFRHGVPIQDRLRLGLMLLGAARRISNVQQHDDREEPPSTRPDRPDQRPLGGA
jgi:hypothetical protein